jgi:hypothetical protein
MNPHAVAFDAARAKTDAAARHVQDAIRLYRRATRRDSEAPSFLRYKAARAEWRRCWDEELEFGRRWYRAEPQP